MTHTPIAERLAVDMSLPVKRLRSVAVGIQTLISRIKLPISCFTLQQFEMFEIGQCQNL